jgi:acyl carrier protein phosphodiesterase
MLKTLGEVRDRLDDMAARLRTLDPLQRRVSAIEKRLDSLEKPKAARPAPRRKAASRPKRPSS